MVAHRAWAAGLASMMVGALGREARRCVRAPARKAPVEASCVPSQLVEGAQDDLEKERLALVIESQRHVKPNTEHEVSLS